MTEIRPPTLRADTRTGGFPSPNGAARPHPIVSRHERSSLRTGYLAGSSVSTAENPPFSSRRASRGTEARR